MTFWLVLALFSQGWGQSENRPRRPRSATRQSEPQVFVQLPQPEMTGSITQERALQKITTVEPMSPLPLTGSAIGQLTWSAAAALAGANLAEQWLLGDQSNDEVIELYVVTYEGLFQYTRHGHRLQQLSVGDTRTLLTIPPDSMGTAINHGAAFIIADSRPKLKGRRGDIQQRQTLLKAGQILQSMRLQAASLDLASLPLEPLDERYVRDLLELPKTTTPLVVLLVGYRLNQVTDPQRSRAPDTSSRTPQAESVILVVPPNNYQDQELQQVQQALTNAGLTTKIASTRLGPLHGILGQTAYATILLDRVKADDLQALVFIGGPGTAHLADNKAAQAVAVEAIGQGKTVGALSTGVRILADAGLIKGVRVTGHPSDQERLSQAGAIYTSNDVEQDHTILTASGPAAAPMFGNTLVSRLKAQP